MYWYIKAKPKSGGISKRVSAVNGNICLVTQVMYASFWDEEYKTQALCLCKELNESIPDYTFQVEKA